MSEAACIKKFGWEDVEAAVFEGTRSHFDLPCFCGEHCDFLDTQSGACTYSWPERKSVSE